MRDPRTARGGETRLLVLSDLHLEQRPTWSIPADLPEFDVAVVAGDVDATPALSVRLLASAPGLAERPVVYVPGNHEFYGGTIEARLREGIEAAEGTRVHLLDRSSIVLEGVRFVGATLWTDYRLLGNEMVAMVACQHGLKDSQRIRTSADGEEERFLSDRARARHASDLAAIEAALAVPFEGPSVVVTHHAPHRGSLDVRYAGDPLSCGYVSHLERVVVEHAPAAWIHGHVHLSFDYDVEGTRIVCNPKGYGPHPPETVPANREFDPRMMIGIAR